MMTQAVSSYAAVLLTLPVTAEMTEDAETAFSVCPQLGEMLGNPTVLETEKFTVITRLFPEALQSFLKVVCRNGQIDCLPAVFAEYRQLKRQQKQQAFAVLEYVTPLTETQLAAMRKMVCAKTGSESAEIELRHNPALLGGFVLRIGDETYDRSMRRTMKELHKSMIRR